MSLLPEVEELTSAQSGAILLTKMLQYGEHLPKSVHVKSVQNLQKDIKDGVKGDKALLEVTYSEEVELPKVFFVKSPGFKSWVRFLSTFLLFFICSDFSQRIKGDMLIAGILYYHYTDYVPFFLSDL